VHGNAKRVSGHVAAVLTFGCLSTCCALAICSSSLGSAYSMAALVLSIGVFALLSALLARDKAHVVAFSPLDLLMRFMPGPSWRILMGLMGALAVLFGVLVAAIPHA
jgi:hypothetical protein